MSETYTDDDDDVLYHYKAPVRNENQLILIRVTPDLVEFTNQIQNIVNRVFGFHWITGCETVYHV